MSQLTDTLKPASHEALTESRVPSTPGSAGSPLVAQASHHGGWQTLFYKEVLRFWKVGFQMVGAPVLTAVLYLLIFGHVLEGNAKV
ncbi:MAG: metal-dependent hydrolase, partial [Rhodoferax sp.]|nr:metal-dependent hydrolase [Rhodoferax sp.]